MPTHGQFSGRDLIATFAIVLALSALPLFFVTYPPLHDYPFHIGRIYIITHLDDSSSLRDWYTLQSFLLPNVGMDLVTIVLAKIFPIDIAGRVFVVITFGIMLGGCVFLNRTLQGKISWWPFVAAFFLYNWIFLFGFLNYLLGVGIFLWAAGAWVAWRHKPLWLRMAFGTVFSVALFFCHLAALGVFAVFLAGYELQQAIGTFRKGRWTVLPDLLASVSIFTPPLILLLLSPTSGEARDKIGYNTPLLPWKAFMLFRSPLSGDWFLDITLIFLFLAVLVLGCRYGRISIAKSMALPLTFLLIAFVALPIKAMDGFFVDTRIPAAILFVAIASLDVTFAAPRMQRAVVAGLTVALIARSIVLSYDWSRYDRVIHEFTDAFARMPPNAILFSASQGPLPKYSDLNLHAWQPPLTHMASLATLYQTVFVATTFAAKSKQPINVTTPYRPIYDFQAKTGPLVSGPIPVDTQQDLETLVNRMRALVGRSAPAYCLILDPKQPFEPPPGTSFGGAGSRFVLLAIHDNPPGTGPHAALLAPGLAAHQTAARIGTAP